MKSKLKKLIAEGKTDVAIRALLMITEQLQLKDIHQEVILQSARFEKLEKDQRIGTTSAEEENISLAKINTALLGIIGRLPAAIPRQLMVVSNSLFSSSSIAPLRKKKWRRVLNTIVGIIGIIGMLIGILNFTLINPFSSEYNDGPPVSEIEEQLDSIAGEEGERLFEIHKTYRFSKNKANGLSLFCETPDYLNGQLLPSTDEMVSYEGSKNIYIQSLKKYEQLAKNNPQHFNRDVARTLFNLGVLLKKFREYKQADTVLNEALMMYKQLTKVNPQRFAADQALVQMNLGETYAIFNDFERADTLYKDALKGYRELADHYPQRYLPEVALVQLNQGLLYAGINDFETADSAFRESRDIYTMLAKENPHRFEPDVARTQLYLGILYANTNHHELADSAFNESLNIYTQLAEADQLLYKPNVALAKLNKGAKSIAVEDYAGADTLFNESLDIYKKLVKEYPGWYNIELCFSLLNIAYLKQIFLEEHKDVRFHKEGKQVIEEVDAILALYDHSNAVVKSCLGYYYELSNYFEGITEKELAALNDPGMADTSIRKE